MNERHFGNTVTHKVMATYASATTITAASGFQTNDDMVMYRLALGNSKYTPTCVLTSIKLCGNHLVQKYHRSIIQSLH
jgi:hypothetical protein